MPRRRKDLIHFLEQTTAQRPPVLNVSNSNLEGLVDRICEMDWLVELNLSHCHISTLPEAIANLTGLTSLELSENRLATLPEAITRLTSLRHLNLRGAGLSFSVSDPVKAWLKTLPEVIWTDGNPPNFDPPPPSPPVLEHPNEILGWLQSSLKLYGDALSMEDRGFSGSGKREEADALIKRVFQIPEMKEVLPEFYRDHQAKRFYSTNCESEKSLDRNPFRLPTEADAVWLAAHPAVEQPPLSLDSFVEGGRHILAVNRQTGAKAEVGVCTYGWVIPLEVFSGDDRYFADCTAWLYQAGSERFYVRLEIYGSGIPSDQWFGSSDDGASWQEQAGLTYAWLNKNYSNWRELSRLEPAKTREKQRTILEAKVTEEPPPA